MLLKLMSLQWWRNGIQKHQKSFEKLSGHRGSNSRLPPWQEFGAITLAIINIYCGTSAEPADSAYESLFIMSLLSN